MIDDFFVEGMNSLNALYNPAPPPNGTLYHYTDFSGLLGILKTNELWATYNRVMNDASEGAYAEAELRKELNLLQMSIPEAASVSFETARCYIACFCEVDNLLSMWRSYAANGGGYCLGFDYSKLKAYMCWPNMKLGASVPLLTKLYYGGVPDLLRKFLNAACRGSLGNKPLTPYLTNIIKDPAFGEEQEWRIIALNPPLDCLDFRSGFSNIRPYVKLYLEGKPDRHLPLVSITIGPTVRPEDRPKEIIHWMLEKYGYAGVRVEYSAVPFRL